MALSIKATKSSIGIFDSGVGGLTVLKAITQILPHEDIVYLGDTARTPYGSKAKATVTRFTLEGVEYLLKYNIKALVIACNTASALVLPRLQRNLSIPVLGVIQPGVRAALQVAGKQPIGVIGTRATIASQAYAKHLLRLNKSSEVISQACPLFVPLVEEGWLKGVYTSQIIKHYLAKLLKQKIKTLILGCTHYPALKPAIKQVCGRQIKIIDSAHEVATQLSKTLLQLGLKNNKNALGKQKFLVTDIPEQFIRVGKYILNRELNQVRHISKF